MSLPMVVSIHDVRPGLYEEVVKMLDVLKSEGVDKTSLLVIPNFHREEPIEAYPHIITQIRNWQAQGHELVQHALYHREDTPVQQSALQYIVSRHYTSGEGEFYRLAYDEALQRIELGKALFKQLQFKASGFTAPAWLYSKESLAAIEQAGFDYYTTLWGVQPTRGSAFIPARAVVWSHRAAWRRFTSNTFLPPIARRLMLLRRPLRIALHPPDFTHASIKECALTILRRALQAGYQPTTYAKLVASTATNSYNSRSQPDSLDANRGL